MMNEYLLYKDDVYFGGIFDDRLLVKMTKSVEKYAMSEQLPYEGAKPMYLVDCVDEQDKLCAIISEVTEDLKKNPKNFIKSSTKRTRRRRDRERLNVSKS